MLRALVASVGLTLSLAASAAGEISLALPVDCTVGDSCYIQNYVDADPTDGMQDFTCNALTYDTHKGTDFAVATVQEAQAGVAIQAAAAGVVLGTRDGMPDIWSGDVDLSQLNGKDCGNGLVIDHGEGWHTQYCHLKRGSVLVQKGDKVETGDLLGLMGMSGRTQFPHLHISVRRNGTPVDPFNPTGAACGGTHAEQLWTSPIAYQPGGILSIGFADGLPDYSAIKLGTAQRRITRTSPAIVGYAFLFGGRTGDKVTFDLTGPGDFKVSDTYDVPRNRALFFRAAGKKRRSAPWPGGDYTATARLIRDGALIEEQRITATLPR